MAARRWTDEQRDEALRLYLEHGTTETAKLTGIPKGTVASWARRAGVETRVVPPQIATAVESAAVHAEARRLALAEGMLGDIGQLRARLFAPMEYVHVKVVGSGNGMSDTEQVKVQADQPVPADQLRLVQAIGTLVDKVQLLTGQATERMDLTGEYDLEAELRAYQQGLADRGTVKP